LLPTAFAVAVFRAVAVFAFCVGRVVARVRVVLATRDVALDGGRFVAPSRFVAADVDVLRTTRFATDFFVADVFFETAPRFADDFFVADFLVTPFRADDFFAAATRVAPTRLAGAVGVTPLLDDFAVFDFAAARAVFVRRFVVAIMVLRLRVDGRASSRMSIANVRFTSIK
jgi:hypothetical protein